MFYMEKLISLAIRQTLNTQVLHHLAQWCPPVLLVEQGCLGNPWCLVWHQSVCGKNYLNKNLITEIMQITKKNTDNHYFCQKYGCARFTTCCRSWSHRVCAQRDPRSRGKPSTTDRSACQWQCSPRAQHPRGNSWPLSMFLTATIRRSASPRSAANNWLHSKTLNSLSGGGHAKQKMTYTACARYFVPAPVIKHVTLRPSVTFTAVAPVINFVAPAPTLTDTSPAPMSEYVKPAPAVIYTASAQVVPQERGHQRTVSQLNIEIVERIKVVSRRESSYISFLVTFRNKLCSACTSACMGQQYSLGAGRSITGSGLIGKALRCWCCPQGSDSNLGGHNLWISTRCCIRVLLQAPSQWPREPTLQKSCLSCCRRQSSGFHEQRKRWLLLEQGVNREG